MRTAARLVCLSLALVGASPIVALAQPKPPAAKKAPAPAPAPAPAASNKPKEPPKEKEKAKPGDDSSTLILVGALVGGVLLLGGIGFGISRMSGGSSGSGKGDGRPPEPLLPERKYDWELRLTEDQERAMLQGIAAYRDSGHDMYFSHNEALLTFYEPKMLVSLHRMTDEFLAAGPSAAVDPNGVVRSILDAHVATESTGVLHFQQSWFTAPIDDLDNLKFCNLCYETLTNPTPYIEGSQGSSADENKGSMTVNLEVSGGPFNTFCVDLGRVLGQVQQARSTQPAVPLIELVRPVLQAMARAEIPGAMWTRGSGTPAEIDLVTRMVATGAPRPPS